MKPGAWLPMRSGGGCRGAQSDCGEPDTAAGYVRGAEKERGRVQMDDAIYNLYMKSCITSGTAIAGAKDPEDMRRKVRLF